MVGITAICLLNCVLIAASYAFPQAKYKNPTCLRRQSLPLRICFWISFGIWFISVNSWWNVRNAIEITKINSVKIKSANNCKNKFWKRDKNRKALLVVAYIVQNTKIIYIYNYTTYIYSYLSKNHNSLWSGVTLTAKCFGTQPWCSSASNIL